MSILGRHGRRHDQEDAAETDRESRGRAGEPVAEPTGDGRHSVTGVTAGDGHADATGGPTTTRPSDPPGTGAQPAHPAGGTRVSATWVGTIVAIIVLALLLIFILENLRDVNVTYFGASGQLPLGVALLLAAIGGALLVAMVGVARLTQLRLNARRRRHASAHPRSEADH